VLFFPDARGLVSGWDDNMVKVDSYVPAAFPQIFTSAALVEEDDGHSQQNQHTVAIISKHPSTRNNFSRYVHESD
jgi:hypothetical protein